MSQSLVECFELGLVDYGRAYRLQITLSKLLKGRPLTGYLLFLEHPPTITFGYSLKGDEGKSELRVSESVLAQKGIGVFHTDRGGKATFHGPGQLVAYPVFNLGKLNLSSKRFVNKLEDVVIGWLAKNGVGAGRDLLYPGVWVENKKIASVGVRIEDRVSRHGIAVNLWPDLKYFELIVPCGIAERKMTSLHELTGRRLEIKEASAGLALGFAEVFGVELVSGDPNMLDIEGGRDDNQRMANTGSV
jgi:lipoate-protein ligase B